MAVMAICVINIIGLSNSSYMWTRVCFFIWPIILITVAVRAGFMSAYGKGGEQARPCLHANCLMLLAVFQLDREQGKIIWECNNGGQLWGESAANGYDNGSSMPSGVCSAGFHSLYIAFVLSLLVDFGLQLYA